MQAHTHFLGVIVYKANQLVLVVLLAGFYAMGQKLAGLAGPNN